MQRIISGVGSMDTQHIVFVCASNTEAQFSVCLLETEKVSQ